MFWGRIRRKWAIWWVMALTIPSMCTTVAHRFQSMGGGTAVREGGNGGTAESRTPTWSWVRWWLGQTGTTDSETFGRITTTPSLLSRGALGWSLRWFPYREREAKSTRTWSFPSFLRCFLRLLYLRHPGDLDLLGLNTKILDFAILYNIC